MIKYVDVKLLMFLDYAKIVGPIVKVSQDSFRFLILKNII